jgi:hypothetical protein
MNLEDVRLTLANQLPALDVMGGILALKEETELKVVILLWCWWETRNLKTRERLATTRAGVGHDSK